MKFMTSFIYNCVVSNKEISIEFKCGNMGGMRRSKTTNTLVIISDNTKGLYDDKWQGDILHYTGMGKSGDQYINFMQNKTLSESRHNGVAVHLFEVLIPGQYIYKGEVELNHKPYQTTQRGEDGALRSVWIFPVHLISNDIPVDGALVKVNEEQKRLQAAKLSLKELQQRAEGNEILGTSVRLVKSDVYIRNQYISEYTKRIANGQCQLCREKAPFIDKDGFPYLETHHIVWLSQGGPDTIKNTVALCPNCHRRMHVLNHDKDRQALIRLKK